MLRIAMALMLGAPFCFGHGSTPLPPPRPTPPPPRYRTPPEPPPMPTPPGQPRPKHPKGPTTPPDKPPADPRTPPAVTPPNSPNPTTPKRPRPRVPVRDRPRSSGDGYAWRLWWEYNREHLVGVRGMLRHAGTVTGTAPATRPDPLGKNRDAVLESLRKIAQKGKDRTLRAAAILALGRMGGDAEAYLVVKLMHDQKQPRDVHEAAAVALGILPPIKDGKTRAAAHAYLRYASTTKNALPRRARGLALLATGMRARHDKALVLFLLGEIANARVTKEEAANLALACGLAGDPMTVPELISAVKRNKLGKRKLSVVGRAHAIQALALIGEPIAVPLFVSLLRARSASVDVKRAAALSLGRMLRERDLPAASVQLAERVLVQTLEKGRDSVLRGFCAVALGGAKKPLQLPLLMEAIDHGGNAEIKPFAALALGLAARTNDDDRVRGFLAAELSKTKAAELSSALSISLGLARAVDARKLLHERLDKKSLTATVRGAAAQGLGLMGTQDPEVAKSLENAAFRSKKPALIEDAVLALGLLRRRGIAQELVAMLDRSDSAFIQGRVILALGQLDHESAVTPLLEVLNDKRMRGLVREFAAVALGMLGDRRDEDVLFAVDGYFNFYATTLASNELVRLY